MYAQILSGSHRRICPDKIEAEPANGRICDIGKFLLDPEAVETMERMLSSRKCRGSVETINTAKSLTLLRMANYLLRLAITESVHVITNDGSILLSQFKQEEGRDLQDLSTWSFCAQINTKVFTQAMAISPAQHMVLFSKDSCTVISSFRNLIVLTLCRSTDAAAVGYLLRTLKMLLSD